MPARLKLIKEVIQIKLLSLRVKATNLFMLKIRLAKDKMIFYREALWMCMCGLVLVVWGGFSVLGDVYQTTFWLESDFKDDFHSFIMGIYQVQVTFITLSIALIAILNGFTKETILGITIPEYITSKKYKYLPMKNVTIAVLFCALINAFFISIRYYYTTIFLFVMSILVIVFLARDIFSSFSGQKYWENKIKTHYVFFFEHSIDNSKKKDALNKINEEIKLISMKSELINIKRDLDCLSELYNILKEKNNHLWQSYYIEIINFLMETQDKNINKLALDSLGLIIEKHGIDNLTVIKSPTFFYKVLNAISIFNTEERFEFYWMYRSTMLAVIKNEEENFMFEYYSAMFYSKFINNANNDALLKNDKIRLYEGIFGNRNLLVVIHELLEYTKVLIDSNEVDVLDETYSKKMVDYDYYSRQNQTMIFYFFVVEVYLYYVAINEPLATIENQEKWKAFLKKKKKGNSFFNPEFIFSEDLIEKIRFKLFKWEKRSEEGKILIINEVIDKFLVYYSLLNNRYGNDFSEAIRVIMNNNHENLYFEFMNNKQNIKDEINTFIQYFSNENFSEIQINNLMLFLIKTINEWYLKFEIKDNCVEDESQKKFEFTKSISEGLKKELEEDFLNTRFLTFSKVQNRSYEKKVLEYIGFIYSIKHRDSIKDKLRSMLWNYFIGEIKKNSISCECKDYDDFEKIINEHPEIDTVIGTKYWSNFEDINKYKKFLSDKKKINFVGKNVLYLYSGEQNYIKLNSLHVQVTSLMPEDVEKSIKSIGNEYTCKTINDFSCELSDKDLMLKYKMSLGRNILVTINYEYFFSKIYHIKFDR